MGEFVTSFVRLSVVVIYVLFDAATTDNGKKSGDDGDGGNANSVVVLKADLHCRGCVLKILKCVRGFEGVVDVKVEKEANKLTVIGKVDAAKLREMLQVKTKKKVEIIPLPPPPPPQQQQKKKEEEKENNGAAVHKSVENGKIDEKKSAEKKPKELPVTTVVIKLGGLDCQGCVAKINKIIAKTAGVQDFAIDKDKEVVTVNGTVDPKALADDLREKMRRAVEVVPLKKEKEKEEKGGGGGGGASGGGKKKGGGGGGGKAEDSNGEGKFEGSRMEYYGQPQSQPGYENRSLGENTYGFMYGEQVHAPQLFSDENPNACCVV